MMILFVFMTICIGFYVVYQTSRKAAIRKSIVGLWLSEHPVIAKCTGVFAFVIAMALGTYQLGFGASVFYALIALMTVSSLMIILTPLYFPKK